jgi:hypothetical protein
MLGTDAGTAPWFNLSPGRNVAAEHVSIFIIYRARFVNTKGTYFASDNIPFVARPFPLLLVIFIFASAVS